jgi:hypothetical protein
MKNLILFFVFLSNIFSCSNSQTGISEKKDNWASIQYFYNSGPLPPQYHYDYNISITREGIGNITCNIGYDKSLPGIIYDFKLSKDTIDLIDKAINQSGVLTEEIESLPPNKHPIGGSLKNVRIVLEVPKADSLLDRPPRVKETPEFPVEKYREKLDRFYSTITSLIPKYIWDDVELKRKDFEENYNKQ